ncbi:MAG: hypothetical protein EU530_01515 [Promethearchaeota archaeon]|nr:MAG: hypothetical protein EU530_01515 [Candidatus Lokiarchaeota archaeon]
MSEEEKDHVEIVKISDEDEELDPEEIKELESIIEEVTEEHDDEKYDTDAEPIEIVEEEKEALETPQDDEFEKYDFPSDEITAVDLSSEENPRKIEAPSTDEPKTPTISPEDLGGEENAASQQEPAIEKPPIITGHVIPQDECWLIKPTKSGGLTLPKELRDKVHPQQNFALVLEGHELAFYMINEEDIPKLRLVRKKIEPKVKGKKGKREKKKKEGPEPDFPRYFHFELEDQGKIQDALESAFYKFAENPPLVGEAMNIVIYILTSFIKNHRMNDSRLRQTIIFFLCHIVEQFNQPQLIDFCQREIIDEIQSSYLYQICLNQLAYTSFIMGKPEKADEFITKCVEVIDKYDAGEMYAIMDSFKHLIHTLTPIQGKRISKEELTLVKNSLDKYADKLVDVDYQIQFIELLERLDFVDEAYDKAKFFMDKIDPENPAAAGSMDQFKEIRRRIGHKPAE